MLTRPCVAALEIWLYSIESIKIKPWRRILVETKMIYMFTFLDGFKIFQSSICVGSLPEGWCISQRVQIDRLSTLVCRTSFGISRPSSSSPGRRSESRSDWGPLAVGGQRFCWAFQLQTECGSWQGNLSVPGSARMNNEWKVKTNLLVFVFNWNDDIVTQSIANSLFYCHIHTVPFTLVLRV